MTHADPYLPAALLTDMDGLLLDTEKLSLISFEHVARLYGLEDTDTIFRRLIGLNRQDHQKVFAASLPQGIDPVRFDDDWKAAFMGLLSEDVPVKPWVRSTLSWLVTREVPIAVVTSTRTAKAEGLLQRAGLADFAQIIIGGDQVSQGKPAPDIYLKAAASLGVAAPACLAFEDSANGVRAAHASGAKVIQVVDLQHPDADLRALGHEIVFSLKEAASFLGWNDIPDLEA